MGLETKVPKMALMAVLAEDICQRAVERKVPRDVPVTRLPPLLSQRRLADPGLLEAWHPRETIARAESLAETPGSLSGKQGRQQMA